MSVTTRSATEPEVLPADPLAKLPAVVLALGVGLGAVLFWVPLRGVTPREATGLGLISVLPLPTLLGAAVLTLTFVATLALRRPTPWLLGAQIVVTVVALHTLAQVMEPIARFPTVWQHSGFIEYITRTGSVGTDMDARFSWPAFFAFVGFLAESVGVHDLNSVFKWAPVFIQLLYLLPLAMIVRVMKANWRAKWFAVWLFPVANWVGQDYVAPQAFGYLIYLLFLAILLTWFRPSVLRTRLGGKRGKGDEPGRVYTFLFGPKTPGEEPVRDVGLWEKRSLVILLVVLLVVGTAAHQLTPYLLIASCAALTIVGRCTLRGLPVIGGVIYLAWISFMAYGYWRADPGSTLFAGGGNPIATILESTSGRIGFGDPDLGKIQRLRIVIVLVIMALTVVGLLRRRIRGIDDRVALILLIVPISSFGLQSYGGEIALRTYMFMLPGAVFLAAYAFYPDPKPVPVVRAGPRRQRVRRWGPTVMASTFALLLMGGFMVVRYGNEAFEQVRPSELRAIDAMLEDAGDKPVPMVWVSGEVVTNGDAASATPQGPWGYRSFERFSYVRVEFAQEPYRTKLMATPPVAPTPAEAASRRPSVDEIVAKMQENPGSYLFSSRTNDTYQVLNFGLAADWNSRLVREIKESGQFTEVYSGPDASVYKLVEQRGEPAKRPTPTGLIIGVSNWTPAGLIYLPVLIGVLTARELRRIRLSPDQWTRLRPYTVVAFPLFVGFVAIVVERFLTLKGSP
ncbi:hypothetical protein LO762_03505 [Actinocorallia sp. API 0066]|uniref:hypothetical protein n=1 Tax=Actinocorallia sp. API 0066 TaxID=2896846 RepID=UPI001E309F01|nr:hypothetical protein [Actinocorallia sp. API 0066]MCD0448265.1 hypothetical protein [Actinocorallia sp. API 0066]